MGTFQEPKCLSVVIPTLDAAGELRASLAALTGSRLIRELIVSDGGSNDGTVAVAETADARVISGCRGRGLQLIAGAGAATGEWLLFLHADCRLMPGWGTAVREFITGADAAERAGYFSFALDDPDPAAQR